MSDFELGRTKSDKATVCNTRMAQVMPPTPIAIAVKRSLGIPVYGLVRTPIGKTDWTVTMERIA